MIRPNGDVFYEQPITSVPNIVMSVGGSWHSGVVFTPDYPFALQHRGAVFTFCEANDNVSPIPIGDNFIYGSKFARATFIYDHGRIHFDAAADFADVPPDARPLIRQSAIIAAPKDPRLKKRTLTNLYNERPRWLRLAHEKLDRAVLAAYAASDPAGNWSEDWAQVWTENGAGQPLPENHPLAAERKRVDQLVLANLLRLNQARSI